MRRVESEVEVHAPPAVVWSVATDASGYREWNPFLVRVEGPLREGEELTVRAEPPGTQGVTYHPTVTAVEPERRLAWLGRYGLPRLFDASHELRLEPVADGEHTRLVTTETFRGALVPLYLPESAVRSGVEAMNEALKARAEAELAPRSES